MCGLQPQLQANQRQECCMRQRIWQRLRRTSLGQMRSTSLKIPRYSHSVSNLESLCTQVIIRVTYG